MEIMPYDFDNHCTNSPVAVSMPDMELSLASTLLYGAVIIPSQVYNFFPACFLDPIYRKKYLSIVRIFFVALSSLLLRKCRHSPWQPIAESNGIK
jgi:hypothetical protein